MSSLTKLVLNTGKSIPSIGIGTWKSAPGEVHAAVECAIRCGYRHIDCAAVYENEREIGDAVSNSIKSGVVKREDLFITSKLWNTDHQPEHVKPAIEESLSKLQLNYLDLYLMHMPVPLKHGHGFYPLNEQGQFIMADVDYVPTWKAMETLQHDGLTKSIGLSNFNQFQIERILRTSKVFPSNLQVESHPYFPNEELFQFCKSKNITFTAYSPLGSGDNPWVQPGDPKLLEDPKIIDIANRLGKSPGQVAIRFQVQRGAIVIPKSVTPSRIKSNFDIFGFELTKEDMKTIAECNKNKRACQFLEVAEHKYYPFKENYSE